MKMLPDTCKEQLVPVRKPRITVM